MSDYPAWAAYARQLLAAKGHPTTNRIDARYEDFRLIAARQAEESRQARGVLASLGEVAGASAPQP
jgi:hypothetical protein